MGMFVNPDNSAFQAALNARIYIDKSGLINYTNSVLASSDAFICNSRPRRFGKSITANMLTAYYSKGCNSEKMFSGLEVSKSGDFKKHLNKYDVIHLDIQWCLEPAGKAENLISYISENFKLYLPITMRADQTAISLQFNLRAELYNLYMNRCVPINHFTSNCNHWWLLNSVTYFCL